MDKYVITIARTFGSGGKSVGKLLAKELGIKYYDREILRMASDDSGISEGLFGEADEKSKSKVFFGFAKKSHNPRLITPDSEGFVSDDNLFNYQSKIIRKLADEESCVIMGRCADHILKDNKNAIRVFCYAPFEDCVRREMEVNQHSEKESRKLITKTDKERASYYKYYTGAEWSDARHYDLCINTSSLRNEEILELIKSFIEVIKNR